MPIIREIHMRFQKKDVLRRIGLRNHSSNNPEIKRLALELLADVENGNLIEPAVVYETYHVSKMTLESVSLEEGITICGTLLPSALPQAKEIVIAICTIGPNLERKTTNYSKQGKPLLGVLLDGIGSAAVDVLTLEMCKFISDKAALQGYQASSPLYPGMPGLPLAEQGKLHTMAGAQNVGVCLTSSGIMVPRKSVSMILGVGPVMSTWTQSEACSRCNLSGTCTYSV